MSNLRLVRGILYQLKRDFPCEILLRNISLSESNKKTGVISKSFEVISVRRAILLPAILKPSFIYDLSFIAASKNFTYGGLFGASTRVVIVDGRDIPSLFKIEEGLQVVFKNQAYVLKSIEKLVENLGFLLTVTALTTSEP